MQKSQYGINPDSDMQMFIELRYYELCQEIKEYRQRCQAIKSYEMVLVKVVMKILCEEDDYDVFDKRFVTQEYIGNSPLYLLQPVNELAARVFKCMFDSFNDDSYDDYVRHVAKDKNLVPGARYSHVENYIIHKMVRCQMCKLSLKWLDKDGIHKDAACISYDEKLAVIHFKGTSTPEVAFNRQATLYWPDNKFYPGVDFILFLPGANEENDILWAIQVTGSSKPSDHIIINVGNFHPHKLVHSSAEKKLLILYCRSSGQSIVIFPPKMYL